MLTSNYHDLVSADWIYSNPPMDGGSLESEHCCKYSPVPISR